MKKDLTVNNALTWWNEATIGLDLSLTCTGYCMSSKEGSQAFGTIEPGDKRSGCERIKYIRDHLMELPLKPLAVIEDFGFGTKGRGFEIGGLGWAVRIALYERKMPYILVAPTVVKKFVCGVGNVDKNVILKEVYKRWNFDTNDDNVADAFALNKIAEGLVGRYQPQTSIQLMILEDLLKNMGKQEGTTIEFLNSKLEG